MQNKDTNTVIPSLQHQHIDKLQNIVQRAIEEETSIVNMVANPTIERRTFGQKIADMVARFGGSWSFIISFWLILIVWIAYNIIALRSAIFDPYPFILLNLLLSTIAALQAPVIMMSQNRQAEKDRKQSESDYLINLKSEIELRSLHQKIDLLLEEQIGALYNTQAEQLKILEKIRKKLQKH